ncbi:hypothetical protein [Arundinibacter roseus]|uniref:DUF3850 domain-containing protein n=1 Tax=Arundinibacter roseus TaxID=2070510 RepID=A0A4R4JYM7_9BACT|nr:hypothetical protein [Arundinibacter roseus]TDB60067.1 hypothetical protein EZE20_21590 [Arundinibacter roseus]
MNEYTITSTPIRYENLIQGRLKFLIIEQVFFDEKVCVGDRLMIKERCAIKGEFTGRSAEFMITSVEKSFTMKGLHEAFLGLSITKISEKLNGSI